MSKFDLVHTIIEALQPDFSDYADNAQFNHWMDYACELDEIQLVYYKDETELVPYINKKIATLSSDRPQHHACIDVASTLESLSGAHKGVFVYA